MVKKQETKEGEEAKQPSHVPAEKPKIKAEKPVRKPSQKTEPQAGGECTDRFCPIHGESKVHGRVLEATVVSAKAHKTAKVDKVRSFYLTKFERYERRHTKLLVHNPPCINAKPGDEVRIMESRPLSKTKHFIIIEVLKRK
jgi:small subunit ribosomal protein S17